MTPKRSYPSSPGKGRSQKKSRSPEKSISPNIDRSPGRTASPTNIDPRIKAFINDANKQDSLCGLGVGIPKPEGLKRATWRRCADHRGKYFAHKDIQDCEICSLSSSALALVKYMSDRDLGEINRSVLSKTVRHKVFAEEQFRTLFRLPSPPELGMAFLRSFLPEQLCDQLQYIFDNIGYDLNFSWIP